MTQPAGERPAFTSSTEPAGSREQEAKPESPIEQALHAGMHPAEIRKARKADAARGAAPRSRHATGYANPVANEVEREVRRGRTSLDTDALRASGGGRSSSCESAGTMSVGDLRDHVAKALEGAPPLKDAQRQSIARLLTGGGAHG